MFTRAYDELKLIDKTPLQRCIAKGKIEITEDLVIIKLMNDFYVISYILNLLTVSFWIFVIYNLLQFQFSVFGENETPITLLIYGFGLIITLISWATKKKLKKEEFINRKTGELYILDNKKKIDFEDIIGLQLLGYSQEVSYKGTKYTSIKYELNLITNNKNRLALYLFIDNKLEAIHSAEKLSVFFKKPLILDLKKSHAKEKEIEKSTKTMRLQKGIIVVSANVVTSIKSLNKLINRKEFEVTEMSENKYSVNTVDPFFSFLNLPKKIKQINATFTVHEKTNFSARIKIKTNFRVDLLLCVGYLIYFFFIIFKKSDSLIFSVILGILFMVALIRIFNIRAKEKEFVSEILEILLPEDEEPLKIEFNYP